MSLICPKCGRSDDETAFIEAFCTDCYPVNIKVPDKVELEQCARCRRVRIRGDWAPYNEGKISELVLSRCRGDFQSSEYDVATQTARFTALFTDIPTGFYFLLQIFAPAIADTVHAQEWWVEVIALCRTKPDGKRL